jgi:hypothetical protein
LTAHRADRSKNKARNRGEAITLLLMRNVHAAKTTATACGQKALLAGKSCGEIGAQTP